MNNDNTYDHLVGLDRGDAVRFIVETAPMASPLSPSVDSVGELGSALSGRVLAGQRDTVLDRCLERTTVDVGMRSLEINIPTPREVVVMAAFPGESMPTMILYPPSVTRQKVTPGILSIPIFTVDYLVRPIPARSHVDCVITPMNRLRDTFEGGCCHELLLKAVRSQRNVLKTGFDNHSISEAISLVERGYRASPDTLLLNSEALSVIRDDVERGGGTLYGLHPVLFNPGRRGVERRNYIMARSLDIGFVAKSSPQVTIEGELSGDLVVRYSVSIGAVITNRSAIASIED